MTNHDLLTARVHLDDDVRVEIVDRRADSLALLAGLPVAMRPQVSADAWRFGLRALSMAVAEAREARLEDIGEELKRTLTDEIGRVGEEQRARLQAVLSEFFDPESGQLPRRLAALVEDDGEIAAVLRTHLAAENGTLAQTLAAAVGENSPLLRRLDPDRTTGVVPMIADSVKQVLDRSHASLADALNPRVANSPVAQFLASLRDELRRAGQDTDRKLQILTSQLDANDEGSLLSRLVRQTRESQQQLAAAINPEIEGSPFQVLRGTLERALRSAAEEQRAALNELRVAQASLQVEVREAVARMEARRSERDRSTAGGIEFEEVALERVFDLTRGLPVRAAAVGATTGAVARSKKGDGVLEFSSESAFAGARVVIEVKRDRTFTTARALDELQQARANRGAQVGLLVLADGHAPTGFPSFLRDGADVLVRWSPEDPALDAMLRAAVSLCCALVSRSAAPGDETEAEQLQQIVGGLDRELRRLADVRALADAIRQKAEKLVDEVDAGQREAQRLADRARDALSTRLGAARDPARERGAPIDASSVAAK